MNDLMEKLEILADSAKYDVSCSSSGSNRKNTGRIGDAHAAGICHSWSSDGRCISLLKILMSNKCAYDCEYCVNRRSSSIRRAAFEPDELARLTIEFYRRNYIEGLFLSSAVEVSPDHTAERMLEAITLLRNKYGFSGYIHTKIIPGTSEELVHSIGLVADRLSVNIEMPSSDGLQLLAPQKKPKQIFAPMRQITTALLERNNLPGPGNMFMNNGRFEGKKYDKDNGDLIDSDLLGGSLIDGSLIGDEISGSNMSGGNMLDRTDRNRRKKGYDFAPAGQTTQMIVGAGNESDLNILTTSENLYKAFGMKRVYYSAYVPVVQSSLLPVAGTPVPLHREHRIYQADWLLRFYGFTVAELFQGDYVNLDPDVDPKVTWALRNLDIFPVEINRAPYEMLMRVPGIGQVSAKRIIRQRKLTYIRIEDLKKMGVVMKRAKYFVTCNGRYYGENDFDPQRIKNLILQEENGHQISMFDSNWNRLSIEAGQEKLSAIGLI